jgi:hypothetical protein
MGVVNFCKVILLMGLIGVMGVSLCASDAPPMPSLPDDSLEGDAEGDGETPETNVPTQTPVVEVDWSVQFSHLNWQAWDELTQSWFATVGVGDDSVLFPPTPPEVKISVGQMLQDLPSYFCAVTNVLDYVTVEGIKTWGFSVGEFVSEEGGRRLETRCGKDLLHVSAVPSSFNPEAWSLAAYNRGNPLPDWFNEDAELRETWFLLRGRERLQMSFTFVEPGMCDELRIRLQARADALRAEQEANPAKPQKDIAFLSLTPEGADNIKLEIQNKRGVDLGLLTQASLRDAWDYQGRLPMDEGQSVVTATVGDRSVYPARFFKAIDLTTDSDRDGLPDGLEVAYFKTNPEKLDTTDCGLDDWSKIYVYGLDPTIPDNDGDGILDGEDETPLQAGPEIQVMSPIEGNVYYLSQNLRSMQVSVSGAIIPVGEAVTDQPRYLKELWINQVNQVNWKQPQKCEPNFLYSTIVHNDAGKHSVIIEAVQDGNPLRRSRKRISYIVKPLGPTLHLIEPQDNAEIAQSTVVIKTRVEKQNVKVYCNGMEMCENGYYRFAIFSFQEADLNVKKIFNLRAVDHEGNQTAIPLRLTMTQYVDKEIKLDHIINKGSRVFQSTLDGMTIGVDDEALDEE